MSYYVHPEVGQKYLTNLAAIARRKSLSYEASKAEAATQTRRECLADTQALLASLCPGVDTRIGELERIIQYDEMCDEILDDVEDEV